MDQEELFDAAKMEHFFNDYEFRWTFNLSIAPQFECVWGKLIGSFKDAFNTMVSCQSLTDNTLNTLLCEDDLFIKNRPIILVSTDSAHMVTLNPNHFVLEKEGIQHYPLHFKKTQSQQFFISNVDFRRCFPTRCRNFSLKPFIQPCFQGASGPQRLHIYLREQCFGFLQEISLRGLWQVAKVIASVKVSQPVDFKKDIQFEQHLVMTPNGEQLLSAIKLAPIMLHVD